MPYDENGNYTEICVACESGGCMRDGMDEKKQARPDNDKPVEAVLSNVDHVSEIVELRAIVSRHKTILKAILPWVVSPEAHRLVGDGLADNGNLKYQIH